MKGRRESICQSLIIVITKNKHNLKRHDLECYDLRVKPFELYRMAFFSYHHQMGSKIRMNTFENMNTNEAKKEIRKAIIGIISKNRRKMHKIKRPKIEKMNWHK